MSNLDKIREAHRRFKQRMEADEMIVRSMDSFHDEHRLYSDTDEYIDAHYGGVRRGTMSMDSEWD